MQPTPWIGVDFDGTLCTHEPGQYGNLGRPIPAMVDRVKQWLSEGRDVRIMTARANQQMYDDRSAYLDAVTEIGDWCELHLGERIPITASKDFYMIALYDDRAVQVVKNVGALVGDESISEVTR